MYYGATFLASIADATVSATKSQGALAACSLYPNPAHATASVQLPPISGTPTATLTVLDVLGRTLNTQTAPTNARAELDLTGLPAGLYTLRVQAGGSTVTRRLVGE